MDLIINRHFLNTRNCIKYKNINIKKTKSSYIAYLYDKTIPVFEFEAEKSELVLFLRKFERTLLANALDPHCILDSMLLVVACEDIEDLIRAIKYANPCLENIDDYI